MHLTSLSKFTSTNLYSISNWLLPHMSQVWGTTEHQSSIRLHNNGRPTMTADCWACISCWTCRGRPAPGPPSPDIAPPNPARPCTANICCSWPGVSPCWAAIDSNIAGCAADVMEPVGLPRESLPLSPLVVRCLLLAPPLLLPPPLLVFRLRPAELDPNLLSAWGEDWPCKQIQHY